MKSVTVKKDQLLDTMRANRDQHREEYIEARKKYQQKAVEELRARLARAEDGDIDLVFDLPKPVDYTESYEDAIQMIEWEIDGDITLDHQLFQRYVLNKWEWQQVFAAATRSYLG